MDLTIKTADLKKALALASVATDRGKSMMPIVTQIYLTADRDGLLIRATDLERVVMLRAECHTKHDGEAALNFAKLAATINLIEAEDVRLKRNKNDRLEITYGKSTSRIPCDTVTKFVELSEPEGPTVEVGASALMNGLRQVLPSLNSKDSGVIGIESRDGVLRLVGMNLQTGHLFNVTEISCPVDFEFSMIVERESAEAVRRFLAGMEGHVRIQRSPNGVAIHAGDDTLYFREPAKKVPNVDPILGKKRPKNKVTVSVASLENIMRRALIFQTKSEREGVCAVNFDKSKEGLSLSFRAQDGEIDEVIETPVESALAFTLNADYVLSFIGETWAKDVEILYGSETDPVFIKPSDREFPLSVINVMKR